MRSTESAVDAIYRIAEMVREDNKRSFQVMRLQSKVERGDYHESWYMERGKTLIDLVDELLIVHPSTAMILRNNGRVPLHTRCTLGAREAERDRRQ